MSSQNASPKATRSPKNTRNAQSPQKASGNTPVKRDIGSGKSDTPVKRDIGSGKRDIGSGKRDIGSGKSGTSSKHGGEKKDAPKKGDVSSAMPQAPRRRKKKRGALQRFQDWLLYGGSQIELPEGPARTACDMLNCKYN